MIRIKEIHPLKNFTVLVCDFFPDDAVTFTLKIGREEYSSFHVEPPKVCFSAPKTRDIIIYDSRIPNSDRLQFV